MLPLNIFPFLSASGFITCALAFVVGFLVAFSRPKRPILYAALCFNGILIFGLLTWIVRSELTSEHARASFNLLNVMAGLTLQTFRNWILLYALSQPAFLFSSCIGVALGVALFGQHTGGNVSIDQQVPPKRLPWSPKAIFLLVAGLAVVCSHTYTLHSAASQTAAFSPPHFLRSELQNLSSVEMVGYRRNGRSMTKVGREKFETCVEGECDLTEESLADLMREYEWEYHKVDDLSDIHWLGLPDAALLRERLLVSDSFDQTFQYNPRYCRGMVAIDAETMTLYFRAGDVPVESGNSISQIPRVDL